MDRIGEQDTEGNGVEVDDKIFSLFDNKIIIEYVKYLLESESYLLPNE